MGIRTTARIGRTLTAGVVIGAPALLLYSLGRPHLRWPDSNEVQAWIGQPLTPGFLTVLALAAGWVLWALLATTVLTQLHHRGGRRLRRLGQLRLPGPVQGLTAALLGATAVTAGASGTAPALAVTAADLPDNPTPPAGNADSSPRPTGASADRADTGTAVKPRTVTVRRGDTLSGIAARRLDDADRWREIYSLNRGTHFTTGSLTDPDLIRPGWKLRLPADANTPAPPTPSTPPRAAPDTTPASTPPPPPDKDTSPPASPDTAPDTSAPSRADRSDCDQPGVSLGDRSWIEAALAAALLAAAALAWTRRKHHTSPRYASPNTLEHGPQPRLPAVLALLRRALPDLTPPYASATSSDSGNASRASATAATLTTAPDAAAAHPHTDPDPALTAPPHTGTTGSLAGAGPATDALTGRSTGAWPESGLGLTGPAAQAAARGLLVSTLTAATPEQAHHGQVIVPSTVLDGLLDDQAGLVADTPGLIVTDTLTDALTTVEEQILHRTRVCVAHEADTIPALRDAHPSTEAPPPLLLIADATAAHEHARIAALLTQGQRLDIHGVLLGPWPYGDTVTIAGNGFTTSTDDKEQQGIHPPEVGRLTVLTTADTLNLLATLTDAHQPSATKSGNAGSTSEEHLAASASDTADAGAPCDVGATTTPALTGTPRATTTAETPHRLRTPPTAAGPSGDHGGRVKVQVLGGAHILGRDTSLPLRAKALELLVYLTVHDGEANQDAILDDLLPDAPASKAPHRLHTYVSALRKALAHTGGPGTYLTHTTHRYALNRHTVDTDLWQMRAALRDADRATDIDRLTALRRAVDAYRGNLACGFDYEWIEAHREGVRRQALDAYLTLATTTPVPNEALTVIQAAIRHDPYAEPLYQQAMRIHAALGHADAIHALRQDLTRRLADIDAQPSETILALAHRLIADPRPHRPAGHPRRRDHGPRS
ncbi:BTAD domain-containing putative transcriptional regulator [Micromonospora carbonacea]|uniref:LysM domain-containing protein n=1 Tax=Micromonospora carbonacea TaxID=47853 RepID=A0A1C4YF11_9ACTN|nr:BTAD domain-containing putative transcriptional regulator [Micromonospora carbonacea]SCF18931.1 LysM domain-containing protein [Micromonospora carbonacea]